MLRREGHAVGEVEAIKYAIRVEDAVTGEMEDFSGLALVKCRQDRDSLGIHFRGRKRAFQIGRLDRRFLKCAPS